MYLIVVANLVFTINLLKNMLCSFRPLYSKQSKLINKETNQ